MVPVDVDDPDTWPSEVIDLVADWAEQYRGATEYTSDLPLPFEGADLLLDALGGRLLRARHCTRLLPHEVEMIRSRGLRPLSPELMSDRINTAEDLGCISPEDAQKLHTAHVFATGEQQYREAQVCLVLSRRIFRYGLPDCLDLLSSWGGEALYRSSGDMPERLKKMGEPTVVVAVLDVGGRGSPHLFFASLHKVFVGSALDLDDAWADVSYKSPVLPIHIEEILQPGDAGYHRLGDLPT